MPTFASMQTPNGHLCGEVASALQKSIRRGLERESLYWASELYLAGYGDYVFRRLRVIASEDVGMAAPEVAVQVRALSLNYLEQKKHNKTSKSGSISGERLFLAQAVLVLVRAPKSRMVDHIVMAVFEGDREPLETPDWALDKHTARGRRVGRGEEHFFDVGALIENVADLDDPYSEEGRAARTRPRQPESPEQPELDL